MCLVHFWSYSWILWETYDGLQGGVVLLCGRAEHSSYFCICCREGSVAMHKFMNQPRAGAFVLQGNVATSSWCQQNIVLVHRRPQYPEQLLGLLIAGALSWLGHSLWTVCSLTGVPFYLPWWNTVCNPMQYCTNDPRSLCCSLQCFPWLIPAISWPIWPISRGFSWV